MTHPKAEVPKPQPPETQAASDAQIKGRVLVIDDQEDVGRAFASILRRQGGYLVTQVSDGQRGIELIQSGEFDLVVSDVHMPGLDGVELLKAVHEHDPELPVLLVSGNPDLPTAMKAVKYGAFEYLTKPVEMDKLLSSASQAIEARRKRLDSRRELDQYRSGARSKALPREHSLRWTGELLVGRYRLGRLLGEGGMGSVYEGVREDLANMRVAVKVLHADLADRPDLVARFRREAETVAAIDHPNIVRMLDFQEPEGGPVFLVMERLEGMSLGQALEQGPFAPSRAIFVAFQVLAALAAAHQAGVIHRDLKPDNLFLTSISGLSDIVKLLDFGVAKLLMVQGEHKLTETGTVVGTPPYMAPEHAKGLEIDTRADIYAVGCILYETLAGVPPFKAPNYNALLLAIVASDPVPLGQLRSDLDPDLLAIVAKAMAREPEDRFQTANEMAQALSRWVVVDVNTNSPPSSANAALAPTLVQSGQPSEVDPNAKPS